LIQPRNDKVATMTLTIKY